MPLTCHPVCAVKRLHTTGCGRNPRRKPAVLAGALFCVQPGGCTVRSALHRRKRPGISTVSGMRLTPQSVRCTWWKTPVGTGLAQAIGAPVGRSARRLCGARHRPGSRMFGLFPGGMAADAARIAALRAFVFRGLGAGAGFKPAPHRAAFQSCYWSGAAGASSGCRAFARSTCAIAFASAYGA